MGRLSVAAVAPAGVLALSVGAGPAFSQCWEAGHVPRTIEVPAPLPNHGSSRESAGPDPGQALRRAAALVPLRAGIRVVLIDPELAPEPEALRRLDAFIVREPNGSLRQVIYINRCSDLVRLAAAGSAVHVGALAAVIHHEAQHLAGASEEAARRAELGFFQGLMSEGHVPADAGHRYLLLLSHRSHARARP